MRIVEPTLAMFMSELSKAESTKLRLIQAGEKYLEYKKKFGQNDYYTRNQRSMLESYLMQYKRELSHIYDLMHDRGLTNFESSYAHRDGKNKYYPFTPQGHEEPFEEDVQLFVQLMNGNPLYQGGRNAKHTAEQGGRRDSTPQTSGTTASGEGNSSRQGETIVQSIGDTKATQSVPDKETTGNDKRKDFESDVFTEVLFP